MTAPSPTPSRELLVVALAISLAIGACLLLDGLLPVGSLALVFVVAVLFVAVRSGTRAALVAASASFVAYNYFFTEPRLTLRIHSAQDVAAIFGFLVAALVVGQLASRQRAQVVLLQAANARTRALQSLAEGLSGAADRSEVLTVGCDLLATSFGCPATAFDFVTNGLEGADLVRARTDSTTPSLDAADLAAAAEAARRMRPAGRYGEESARSAWWFLPLVADARCLGVVGILLPAGEQRLSSERRTLAESMVRQMAQALERTRLVTELAEARLERETERLRSALLSSVSHDLRSPLASIIGGASSLLAFGDAMAADDRRALLSSIEAEGERLDRHIQNLLDMARLGSGPITLRRDWIGLDEILRSATDRLSKLAPDRRVELQLAADLPPLYVHGALVEQALFNVLENAAKYSAANAPVRVRAWREADRLVVDVIDRGPGIPETERQRVFDLFYRGGDRDASGTGLGLAIARGMVAAHGGGLEALPGEDGVGTTIRMRLPLRELPPIPPLEEP